MIQIGITQINNGFVVTIGDGVSKSNSGFEPSFDAVIAMLTTLNENSKKAMAEAASKLNEGNVVEFPGEISKPN